MLGSEILEVVIGLSFIFLLLSLICSAIREGVESVLRSRASFLQMRIQRMLGESSQGRKLVKALYEHPLIRSLYQGEYNHKNTKKLPSYIPAESFARALLDEARGLDTRNEDRDSSSNSAVDSRNPKESIDKIQSEAVRKVLLSAWNEVGDDFSEARAKLEAWYNSAMDRLSGEYKRHTQRWLFGIGLVVVVLTNADAIAITDRLSQNDALRNVVVAEARAALAESGLNDESFSDLRARLNDPSLPIGWENGWPGPDRSELQGSGQYVDYVLSNMWKVLFGPVIGWLLTTLAITLGAPFWFDVLNKFTSVRSSNKPKERPA